MTYVILPEPLDFNPYSNSSERAAYKARIASIKDTLAQPFQHLNETMKVFARHAIEGGDFSEESILLHGFTNKMGPVRIALSAGFTNAAFLMCVDNVRVYAGEKGDETLHSAAFNKMALPYLPSFLFAELQEMLEPLTVKTPVEDSAPKIEP